MQVREPAPVQPFSIHAPRPFPPRFAIAALFRMSVYNDYARALHAAERLRFYASAHGRPWRGLPAGVVANHAAIGRLRETLVRLGGWRGLDWQMRLGPWFDRRVQRRWTDGDHFISGWPFGSDCFRFAKARGGCTFLDASNSHPLTYWALMEEEHRRWGCPLPPIPRYQFSRMLRALPHVDAVLAPSEFAAQSYLAHGFPRERVFVNHYALDLALFTPHPTPRPKDQPLRIISTGRLSLRKGTPWLLEAFRLVRTQYPSARLLLPRQIADDMRPVLPRFADVPIEWLPVVPLAQLPALLREADLFVLPSIEDGFARTITEALACGLPVITTPHTVGPDLIAAGRNGEIVPIRDAPALADAICRWARIVLARHAPPEPLVAPAELSFAAFQKRLIAALDAVTGQDGETQLRGREEK